MTTYIQKPNHACITQGEQSNGSQRKEYWLAGLFLALFTFVVHGKVFSESWRWDDGAHLNFAARFSPWQYFFDPDIARAYSSANVAPWNLLFYDINLSLFGMNTGGHYAHLLLMVALGTILFYAVLRQWLTPFSAMIGAVALLLGKPTFHIAAGLMHGHYATGFALAMLSILGWTRYLKGERWYWLVLSVLAYLLATTCKEVYVPLMVLLPFLPVGTWRQRLRALLPFLLVAAAYTGWRYLILEGLLGGYSGEAGLDFANAARQLAGIPTLLIGKKLPGIIIAISFIALMSAAHMQRRLNWVLCAVVFCITIFPLLPLTSSPGINRPDRYLFVPWVALCTCLAVILPNQNRPIFSVVTPAVFILALISVHLQGRREVKADLAYWKIVYRFALSADKTKQAIFLGPDGGYKSMVLVGARNAADILAADAPPGNLITVDDTGNGLLYIKSAGMQIFEFKDRKMSLMSQERLTEVFPQYPFLQFNENIPLEIDLSLISGVLHWRLGPYDGNYLIKNHLLPLSPNIGVTLPRDGKIKWKKQSPLIISFCYNNIQQNTNACSPVLNFDFSESEIATWQGVSKHMIIQ